MEKKTVLCAFRGEVMCFVHVLLNALDFAERGYETAVVVEGEAVKVIPEIAAPDHAIHGLYMKVKNAGLIDGVCRACSVKFGVLGAVEKEGLKVLADMQGHASLARYVDQGFQVIAF
ncbi:MAG: cytoplasmic protein [Desulfosoma sp.]|uniref:cytoplasmic protein n=1 Tax=Desulfosoma sp. TaxID=2603217 RepID=UPI0040499D26